MDCVHVYLLFIGDEQMKILPVGEKKGKCPLMANYSNRRSHEGGLVPGSIHICLVYIHKFTIKLDF